MERTHPLHRTERKQIGQSDTQDKLDDQANAAERKANYPHASRAAHDRLRPPTLVSESEL